jgi:nucleoside-diphosphate kinase
MEMERTFVMIKPDGVQRGLVGKILRRFEDRGMKIAGMKLIHVTGDLAGTHYEEHVGKPFYEPLMKYIQS